jgi:hypothetical protein
VRKDLRPPAHRPRKHLARGSRNDRKFKPAVLIATVDLAFLPTMGVLVARPLLRSRSQIPGFWRYSSCFG